MKIKPLISILAATAIACTSLAFSPLAASEIPISAETAQATDDVFYDDFSSGTLDPDKWLVAYKNWGGKVTENGEKVDYNGGVLPQNVSVQNG